MTTVCFLGRPYPRGFEIIPGSLVTNKRVGAVWYDDSGLNGGLVLRIDGDDETYLPDDIHEVVRILGDAGYKLDAESLAQLQDR